jgi:hypothetical protein
MIDHRSGRSPNPGPHPKGVEESDWSHRRSVLMGRDPHAARRWLGFAVIRTTAPQRTSAGPCRPSRHAIPVDPPASNVLAMPARRLPSRVLDATKSYLVSCLADECYRPNCQRESPILIRCPDRGRVWTGNQTSGPAPYHSTLSAGPGALRTPTPAVSGIRFRLRGEGYSNRPRLQVNRLERFFSKSFRAFVRPGLAASTRRFRPV